ncbi:HlyD family secretion protein [Rhizobium sp. BIGb0125]|uniref:efflux RND transporter periplasmic adaptor subunit n=1 Tax=Rhizobium sp. BIGb0125 TaxID=2940618 RepID=UPI0021691971|nr:efflux RND transporter periplasmic adaptor subunit [Rhizobium sp. BIGb0125]MCS4240881.1 HlyD family secretion protein [Rhizobium sp. BIGb0125]
MQRKTIGKPFVVALLSSVFLPFAAMAAEQSPAEAQANLPSIVVTETVKRDLVDRIIATGTIQPVDEIYVQPLVDGLSIDKLNVDIGDKVEANEVLAVLSTDALLLQKSQLEANKAKAEAALAQFKAQVIEAQANSDDASRQSDRAARLGKSGSGSVSQVEQTQAQAEVALARLQAARQAVTVGEADVKVVDTQIDDIDLKLARTGVKSPVAGIIAAKNAKIGAIASGSGTPLFTVIKDGAIELVAELSETSIQKIKIGQSAFLTIAGASKRVEGKVRLVSPIVDPVTRLGSIHITIPADEARSGMYANAEIIVARENALALPLSAVTTNRDGSTARKVEDNIVRQVKIETGIQDNGFVEVLSGLSAGDKVVEKAGAFVRDGDHISPVAASAAVSN